MPDPPRPRVMPRAGARVIAQVFGDDLILFDPDAARCHQLDDNARIVWMGCDGSSTVPDVAARLHVPLPLGRRLVWWMLRRLQRLGLLETLELAPVGRFPSPETALPRIVTVDVGRRGKGVD